MAEVREGVDALDREPYMLERIHRLDEEAVHCIVCDMTSHCYPPYRYDYINAQWVLPFIPPEQFDEVFKHIAESLKPWGLLSGQFFSKLCLFSIYSHSFNYPPSFFQRRYKAF